MTNQKLSSPAKKPPWNEQRESSPFPISIKRRNRAGRGYCFFARQEEVLLHRYTCYTLYTFLLASSNGWLSTLLHRKTHQGMLIYLAGLVNDSDPRRLSSIL